MLDIYEMYFVLNHLGTRRCDANPAFYLNMFFSFVCMLFNSTFSQTPSYRLLDVLSHEVYIFTKGLVCFQTNVLIVAMFIRNIAKNCGFILLFISLRMKSRKKVPLKIDLI